MSRSSGSNFWRVFREWWGRLIIALLVVVGGLCLILGAEQIDHQRLADWHAGVAVDVVSDAQSHNANSTEVEEPEAHTILTRIMRELGFALLVAVSVWVIFELNLRLQADKEFSNRLERVAENVFAGALGANLPQSYVREVMRVAIQVSMMRKSFAAHYTLRDAVARTADGSDLPYVELIADLSFHVQNLGTDSQRCPVSMEVPNPVHASLKKTVSVRVVEVTHNGTAVSSDNDEAMRRFSDRLATATEPNVLYDAGDFAMEPSDEAFIRLEVVMAKEVEDMELIEFGKPCDGLTLTLTDTNPDSGRRIFARTLHRREIRAEPTEANPGRYTLVQNDLFLPHQGALMGWKKGNVAA